MNFAIKSAHLRLDEINRQLRLHNTDGWEAGEFYIGREKRDGEIREVERTRPSFGIWHFNTSGRVESDDLESHALFLLERLEPSADVIRRIVCDPAYDVAIMALQVGSDGFALPSPILTRLANLSKWTSFTCWETQEEEAV